jgi:hypothetical protein
MDCDSMSDSEGPSKSQAELLAVARAMLEWRMNLIEGARRINSLRFAVGQPQHPVFVPIVAVESETDHVPLGKHRDRCAPGWLAEVDEEMREYISKDGEVVRDACREIIRMYSRTTDTERRSDSG